MITVAYSGIMVSILIAGDYYAFVDGDLNVLGRYNYEPFPPTPKEIEQEFRSVLDEYYGDISGFSRMIEMEINNFLKSEFFRQIEESQEND